MMESANFIPVIIAIAIGAVLLLGIAALLASFYRKVAQGTALIVNKMRGDPMVTFSGAVVWPVINKAEEMDISVSTIEIDRRGKEGLICKDNIRADIKVTFFVRVNPTLEDVLKVAQSIGCARASDRETLELLFAAKFSEALKSVGKQLDFEELYTKRNIFRDEMVRLIGTDLNGYALDDAAIDYLEQTPLEHLDAQNILDAQGIRKITEITAAQNVQTNLLKQEEAKFIKKQNVEATEAILELERQEADARAKQYREIQSVKAREDAEVAKIQAEERLKAELARIRMEEEVQINDQNKLRQVEVAQKNRERVIAVESERVEKERALEAISREREVELQRIEKEKALEQQRREIADVIRDRIAVEKTVAEQEEHIKDLRVVAEAKRERDALLIVAEGTAQEAVVKQVKEAEAREAAAKFTAREQLTLADAELTIADKRAQAVIRLAEGRQAEAAAEGLAQARVQEATAVAVEKRGVADARVELERLQAIAAGEEKQGLAKARVQEAEAGAIEKRGAAEAAAIALRMGAEAKGLAEKAAAMKALDGVGRDHEEFRLRLEKEKEIELAQVSVREKLAQAQAEVMGKAFESAKINIVGGDGQFFERFIKAVSLGQATDGALDHSHLAQTLLREYLQGEKSLPGDVVEVLSRPALDGEGLKNLATSALLAKVMGRLSDGDRATLQPLLDKAKDMGL